MRADDVATRKWDTDWPRPPLFGLRLAIRKRGRRLRRDVATKLPEEEDDEEGGGGG